MPSFFVVERETNSFGSYFGSLEPDPRSPQEQYATLCMIVLWNFSSLRSFIRYDQLDGSTDRDDPCCCLLYSDNNCFVPELF